MLDLSATLKEWGLTIGLISLAATTLVLLLVLSLREFIFWYLRLSHIFKQQEEIIRKLDALEHLARMGDETVKAGPASSMEIISKKSAAPLAQFPLSDVSASEKVILDA